VRTLKAHMRQVLSKKGEIITKQYMRKRGVIL